MQLRIFKLPAFEIASVPARCDVDSGFFQQRKIPADRLSLDRDPVFAFQLCGNILLRQRMIAIALILQNLPYSYQCKFFRLKSFHPLFSFRELLCKQVCESAFIMIPRSIRAHNTARTEFFRLLKHEFLRIIPYLVFFREESPIVPVSF